MSLFKRIFRLSDTAAIMCAAVTSLFFVILAIGLLAIRFIYPFEQPLPFGLGLAAGSVLSIIKIILLEKALSRSLDRPDSKSAGAYASLQSILRYFLTILFFLGVMLFPHIFGLFGMIAGVLSMQIAAYITGAVIGRS